MTEAELDGDDSVFNKEPSRILRLARGAGVEEKRVQEVRIHFLANFWGNSLGFAGISDGSWPKFAGYADV